MVDQAGQLQVPTASVKEQIHGFPEDWTLHDNVPERSRHRMVANSWHVGVARFLMMLLCGATQPVDGFSIAIPTSPRQSTLQWMVDEDIYVAFCFSVKQEDKIRRCEDYRRSFHNSTIEAYDSVPHDDIQKYVELARAYSQQSSLCKFWAQDLASAYRQFPVKHPEDCYTVLNTPSGPLLFRHRALPFDQAHQFGPSIERPTLWPF